MNIGNNTSNMNKRENISVKISFRFKGIEFLEGRLTEKNLTICVSSHRSIARK